MSAVRCPICDGRTTVPVGFYGDGDVTCKACYGRGVIFELMPHRTSEKREFRNFNVPYIPYVGPVPRFGYDNQVSPLSDRPDWKW